MSKCRRLFQWSAVLVVGLAFLLATGPSLAKKKPRPIIDMHVHAPRVLEDGKFEWYDPVPDNPVTHEATILTNTEDLTRTLFDAMSRENFVRMVVSDNPENVARWKEMAPENVIQGVALSATPMFEHSVDELRRLHSEGRLDVIGEFMPQYYGKSLTDPEFEPYYALAEELDIPIALHTGLASAPTEIVAAGVRHLYRGDYGSPRGLEAIMNRHPNLRVYLMHAGHPYYADTYALLASYPNIYVEIAYLPYFLPAKEFHRYLKQLVNSIDGMDKRIMFGTDSYLWPEPIGLSIRELEKADYLTKEQKNDIFCGNAARFLRLDESVCFN